MYRQTGESFGTISAICVRVVHYVFIYPSSHSKSHWSKLTVALICFFIVSCSLYNTLERPSMIPTRYVMYSPNHSCYLAIFCFTPAYIVSILTSRMFSFDSFPPAKCSTVYHGMGMCGYFKNRFEWINNNFADI